MITDLIDQLNQTDLRPGPAVNALFGDLVALASNSGSDHPSITDPDRLAEIHRICAIGESNLEDYWSEQILTNPARLHDFPYLGNYQALARAEYRALTYSMTRPLRHVVFAGCGPLPLTALELSAIDPALQITCLDINPAAAQRARAIVDVVAGPQHRVSVVCTDAIDHDYTHADAVMIAALVGATPAEKLHLLARIGATLTPDVLLTARSVPDDGRQLLYPRIDPTTATMLTVLGEWLPPPGVINSLLLLRPRLAPAHMDDR